MSAHFLSQPSLAPSPTTLHSQASFSTARTSSMRFASGAMNRDGGATGERIPGGAAMSNVLKMNNDAQTEQSFFTPLDELFDAEQFYSKVEAEDMEKLKLLRSRMQASMTELGGSIYDLFALKDILLRMKSSLPGAPVTDLLLISSKLFRRGSEIAHLMGEFFSIVFADPHVDDTFHFTEIRLLKAELLKSRQQLETVTKERDDLKVQYEALTETHRDHQSVLDRLETRNDVLEQKSATLEDQMALLFQQLTDDFVFYNEQGLQEVNDDINVQEKLSTSRSVFMQSVDAVQHRLKFFQQMLGEVIEEAAGYNIGDQPGGLKAKIKALDVHVQHIAGRFVSVKEGLGNVAQDLLAALLDKRKILNFSLQHLKIYEIQNSKLRASRAMMHEIRQTITELERVFGSTFSPGSLAQVDRSGEIVITPPSQPDGSRGTVSSHAASNVRIIMDAIQRLMENAIRVTATLHNEDEQKAMQHALTLAVPSTNSKGPVGGMAGPTWYQNSIAAAAAAGGGQITVSGDIAGGDSTSSPEAKAQQMNAGGLSGEQYVKLREDFSVKLTFLREVYEERIADLESKVERLQKRIQTSTEDPGAAAAAAALVASPTTASSLEPKKGKDNEEKAGEAGGSQEVGNNNAGATATATGTAGGKNHLPSSQDDKDKALRSKDKWLDTRQTVAGEERHVRHSAMVKLDDMKNELLGEEKGGGGPRPGTASKPYISSVALGSVTVSPSGERTAVVAAAGGEGGGGELGKDSSSTIMTGVNLPQTFSSVPFHRTSYSAEQHEKNSEVVRTLRRLSMLGSGTPNTPGLHPLPSKKGKKSVAPSS